MDWRLPLKIPENFTQNAADEVSTARNNLSKMSDAIDEELNSTYTKVKIILYMSSPKTKALLRLDR